MGWGCYRHEIDAGSELWQKKFDTMLVDDRAHKPPFTWGRDGQVCPFCWEELEMINTTFQKALLEIQNNPKSAWALATMALEKAKDIGLHKQDPTEKKK